MVFLRGVKVTPEDTSRFELVTGLLGMPFGLKHW
jgi:hypothetical protein